MRLFFYLVSVLALMNFSTTTGVSQTSDDSIGPPLTVAESSEYQSTSKSSEVVDFIDFCVEKANHVSRFDWGKTVEGKDLVGAIVANRDYQLGDQDERNVVLLLGNIHSGECAGKEALLIMLRELTYRPDHPWLKNNVIIFAPNYNADGNDRMGKDNRPGQVGPVNGMGRRENAQQLDLNRDFSKIESPEARALVGLIDTCNPHLFVDCHTTNGSKHQYSLTYDIPHNPATAEPIRQFLREKMMPVVTERLANQGQKTFYYGNFNREHTRWTTYGHEPRYSTEYVGLRGRLAILSEAYSYLDYKGRIFATKDFVSGLLDYMTENSQAIHQLLESVDRELVETASVEPSRLSLSLSAKNGPFEEKFILKGFKDGEPHDYECEFISKYEPTKTTQFAFAYVIPQGFERVVDRLLMHGVSVERLVKDFETKLEVDRVVSMDRAERAFQKHKMVRLDADREEVRMVVPVGSYIVRTAQPLGRWLSYMLEANSDDGYAFWNFFDGVLKPGELFPVQRLPKPVEMDLEAVESVPTDGRLSLELIDGPEGLMSGLAQSPRWFGQSNWLTTGLYNDSALIDAQTAAIVSQPGRPYQTESVKKALIEIGLDKDTAGSLAQSDPVLPTNNRVAVFSEAGYSAIYFIEDADPALPKAMLIGNPDGSADLFHFNDQENRVAFCTKKGLHFLDLDSREITTVASEDEKQLIGKLDWVYQEELYGRGNFKGYWWQSNGDQVAFLKLDETPLFPFTVMDHMPVRGKSEMTNYPKAGDPNPIVTVGVVASADSGVPTWIDLSNYGEDQILISGVSWSSDGKQLLIQVQNREQTWLDLIVVNSDGSEPQRLFRDETPAWIESPGDPVLLANGDFLWRSPRSGYSHIYRYAADGQLKSAVTKGEWEVRSLLGVSQDKRYCYFTAARGLATEIHAYRTDLETGELIDLTPEKGSHAVKFSHDMSFFIDGWSDVETPSRFLLRNGDGLMLRELNGVSDDRLKYLGGTTPQFLEVPSGNEQPMDAMLIKPPNFDPTKKYPVLVHVYAGPQAPRVRNRFGGAQYLWHQMLAQQGYVVWICDNQSASYRSVKHAWPIHRNFAVNELKDIERGVEWLKQHSWVDSDRIGIWGWSYGGYMTAYAMTHSKTFKMGISGAPVTDWKNYDSIYTERYMGLPEENVDGYSAASVLNGKAENLSGNLLLIHGTIDDNVHLNNTVQFVKELQYAGKQFDLMLYPSNRHSVRDEKQAAHLRKLMTKFIHENL